MSVAPFSFSAKGVTEGCLLTQAAVCEANKRYTLSLSRHSAMFPACKPNMNRFLSWNLSGHLFKATSLLRSFADSFLSSQTNRANDNVFFMERGNEIQDVHFIIPVPCFTTKISYHIRQMFGHTFQFT